MKTRRVDVLRLLAQRDALERIAAESGPLAQLASARLRIVQFVLRRYKPNLADVGPAMSIEVVRDELQAGGASPVPAIDLEVPRTHAPTTDAASLVNVQAKLGTLHKIHQQIGPELDALQARVAVDHAREAAWLQRLHVDFEGLLELRGAVLFDALTGKPASVAVLLASSMCTPRGTHARRLAFAIGAGVAACCAWTITTWDDIGAARWMVAGGFFVLVSLAILGILACLTPEVGISDVRWGWHKLFWANVASATLDDADGVLTIRIVRRDVPHNPLESTEFTLRLDRFGRHPHRLWAWADRLALCMHACGVAVTRTWETDDDWKDASKGQRRVAVLGTQAAMRENVKKMT